MAGNPNINQGTLNRVRGSVVFADNATLNVTAPYLGKAGISVRPLSNASELISTLTGGVQSPEVYQMYEISVNLLKTQALASFYKAQFETLTTVGDLSVYTDASTLPEYDFVNGTLVSVGDLSMNGTSPDFTVTIHAIYQVNSSLWG